MSQHYLLDGYNIIKQTPALNRGTLEEQRLALIRFIETRQPQGSLNNTVTVVFDGKEEFFGSHQSSSVRVLFSQGQSADDLIKSIAERYPHKKSLVVISNDKDITLYVRALGGAAVSVKEFLGTQAKASRPLSKQQQSSQLTSSKYVSLKDQDKINKELEQLWIKPKKPTS